MYLNCFSNNETLVETSVYFVRDNTGPKFFSVLFTCTRRASYLKVKKKINQSLVRPLTLTRTSRGKTFRRVEYSDE